MATTSWHGRPKNSNQPQDMARRGTPKRLVQAPIHDGMASQTRGKSLGGSSLGDLSDASSATVTDPTHQGKMFPNPAVTWGTPDRVAKMHDPGLAHAIMNEAYHGPADFARDLHCELPDKPSNK